MCDNEWDTSYPEKYSFPIYYQDTNKIRELINITNRLGHGGPSSILEKMETEIAYKVLSEIKEGCVLPSECKEVVFTRMIVDNIDRTEETLSGEFSQSMKEKCLTHSLLYIIYLL